MRAFRSTVAATATAGLLSLVAICLCGCRAGRSALAHEVFLKQILIPSIERFEADVGRFPTQIEGIGALLSCPNGLSATWRGPYLKASALPRDPWSREYVYKIPSRHRGKSCDVFCLGADGVPSDDDTIVSR